MDAEHLRDFFNVNTSGDSCKDTAVILSVEGRQYPVDIYYIKGDRHYKGWFTVILHSNWIYFFTEPIPDYVQGVIDTVLKIHAKEASGDVLAFLTGQEEVERAVRLLNDHAKMLEHERKDQLLVLPLYGSLPNREQLNVFKSTPKGCRKVVISTNLAETSVTIPGIVYGKENSFG